MNHATPAKNVVITVHPDINRRKGDTVLHPPAARFGFVCRREHLARAAALARSLAISGYLCEIVADPRYAARLMTTYIALLRAVNVGGTGKLPMSALTAICQQIGFSNVRTYIASGNVVFDSTMSESQVKQKLEAGLEHNAKKPVGVLVRTGAEMADILANNPFPKSPPNHTVAIFLDAAPSLAVLDGITGVNGEEVELGAREIYVHYGAGMGRSKLKIPGARTGTARNMNTIAKLVQMAGAIEH
jgi:uncharacterized protein (DUF1697 family)